MDEQYFNKTTGLYEYPVVDLKTGAQAILPAKTPKDAAHIAEKGYKLLNPPNPDPNAPVAGVPEGSPTVNAAKAVADFAIPAIGAAAGAPIAGGSLINRMAGAGLGGIAGRVLATPITQNRLASSPELLAEAIASAAGEGMTAMIVRGPSEAELIGKAVRQMAGVGDPAVKITGKGVRALGEVSSSIDSSRTLFGRDVLASLTPMSKKVESNLSKRYDIAERIADDEGIRLTIPDQAHEFARLISDDLANIPPTHPQHAQLQRLKKTVDFIAERGQPGQGSLTIDTARTVTDPRTGAPVILEGGSSKVPRASDIGSLGGTPATSTVSSGSGSDRPLKGKFRSSSDLFTPAGKRLPTSEPSGGTTTISGRLADRTLAGGKRPVPDMSVKEYSRLVRDIQTLAPNYEDRLLPGDAEDGVLKKLNGLLRDGLDQAVKGTKAEQPLIEAKNYYQNTVVPFREHVVNTLSNSEKTLNYPEVMDLLVQADNPTRLKVAMKHMPEELQTRLKQSWLQTRVLEPATDASTGLLDGNKALAELEKLSPETRHALFQGASTDVEKIMSRLAQDKRYREGLIGKAATVGKVGIPLSVGAFKVAQGNWQEGFPALVAGGAGIWVLGHVLASRRLTRYFARGLEAPNSSVLARRYGQLLVHALAGITLQYAAQPEPGSMAEIYKPLGLPATSTAP